MGSTRHSREAAARSAASSEVPESLLRDRLAGTVLEAVGQGGTCSAVRPASPLAEGRTAEGARAQVHPLSRRAAALLEVRRTVLPSAVPLDSAAFRQARPSAVSSARPSAEILRASAASVTSAASHGMAPLVVVLLRRPSGTAEGGSAVGGRRWAGVAAAAKTRKAAGTPEKAPGWHRLEEGSRVQRAGLEACAWARAAMPPSPVAVSRLRLVLVCWLPGSAPP